jgi:hypothetical protein
MEEASQTSQWKKELDPVPDESNVPVEPISIAPAVKKRKTSSGFVSIATIPNSPISPIPISPEQNLSLLEKYNGEVKDLKVKLADAERRKEKAFSDAKRYYKFCPRCYQNDKIKVMQSSGTMKCKDCSALW